MSYCVIIPTFNRYLECLRAIRSALEQSVPPDEVIVVDDASTDPRYEWLEEIVADDRLTLIRCPENQRHKLGVGFAVGAVRNVALDHAANSHAEWIAFLDDDDRWHTDKMRICLNAGAKYRRYGVISTNAYNIATDNEILGVHHDIHGTSIGPGARDVTRDVRQFNPVICSSAMIHAEIADLIGHQQAFGYGEDWDYWRRAAKHTRLLRLELPLTYYTVGNPKSYEV